MVPVKEPTLLVTLQGIISGIDIWNDVPGYCIVHLQVQRDNQPSDGIRRCGAPSRFTSMPPEGRLLHR